MDVDWQARAEAIEREMDEMERARPSGGFLYSMERLAIRTLRVGAGVVLTVFGLHSCGQAPSITDRPLASLTLGDIGAAIFFWSLACLLVYWGFGAAFGSGPPETRERHRAKAQANVDSRASKLGGRFSGG
jgi:hypothetical protein